MANPIDLKLVDSGLGYIDLNLTGEGDLETTTGLDTTLMMSIFCERRATADEVLKPSRRRGWWGNELNDVPGFEQGSKFWLLEQARLSRENVAAGRDFVSQGIEWMDEDNVINGSEVTTTREGETLNLNIRVGQESGVSEFRFFDALGTSSLIFDEVN
jgi:phage gp46-like protein